MELSHTLDHPRTESDKQLCDSYNSRDFCDLRTVPLHFWLVCWPKNWSICQIGKWLGVLPASHWLSSGRSTFLKIFRSPNRVFLSDYPLRLTAKIGLLLYQTNCCQVQRDLRNAIFLSVYDLSPGMYLSSLHEGKTGKDVSLFVKLSVLTISFCLLCRIDQSRRSTWSFSFGLPCTVPWLPMKREDDSPSFFFCRRLNSLNRLVSNEVHRSHLPGSWVSSAHSPISLTPLMRCWVLHSRQSLLFSGVWKSCLRSPSVRCLCFFIEFSKEMKILISAFLVDCQLFFWQLRKKVWW